MPTLDDIEISDESDAELQREINGASDVDMEDMDMEENVDVEDVDVEADADAELSDPGSVFFTYPSLYDLRFVTITSHWSAHN